MWRKVKSWSSLRKLRKQDLPGNSWRYGEGVKWNEEMVSRIQTSWGVVMNRMNAFNYEEAIKCIQMQWISVGKFLRIICSRDIS